MSLTTETPTAHSDAQRLLHHMARRSHVAPKRLVVPGPDNGQLTLIFSAAAHAPDHGRIQPWRFIMVPEHRRADLGEAFVQALLQRDPQASLEQRDAARDKAFRAPCLVVAVLSDAPSEPPVPRAEKLVSLGCALQNMLLVTQTLNLGSGLTSGQAMNAPALRELLALSPHEEAICFLNLGTVASHKPARPRAEASAFVSSL
jgi:nitroreductase